MNRGLCVVNEGLGILVLWNSLVQIAYHHQFYSTQEREGPGGSQPLVHRAFPGIEGFQIKVPIIFGDAFLDQSLDDFGLVKASGP